MRRLLLGLAFVLLSLGIGWVPSAAQAAPRYFPETQHWVGGRFLQYWTDHGGLAQQGYPLTEEFTEVSALDGQARVVQYFERAVFEIHPENVGTPYEVLLAQLGTYEQKGRYATGAPASTPSPTNPRLFPETHHTLGGVFRAYWESHGGLAQQGYPISDEFQEVNKLNGKTYRVQYFERAIFELHPENAGTAYEVLLTQLGKYQLDSRYPNGSNPAAAPVPPGSPPATAGPAAPTSGPATPAAATATVPTGAPTTAPTSAPTRAPATAVPATAVPVAQPPARPSATRVGTNCEVVAEARKGTVGHTGTIWISYVEAVGQEWVEIFNGGTAAATLDGWTLRDQNETEQAYRFAAGTTLAPGSTIQVFTEPGHPYTFNSRSAIWNNCGDALQLLDSTGNVVATYAYGTHCTGNCPGF